MSAPTAAQQAAADQALRWSLALAGPGRQFGPSLVPCDEDKRPIKLWEWKHEHAPKYEQSRERLVLAMRHSQFASTWAITPASDGLIVIDVDNMDYLARALEDFGLVADFERVVLVIAQPSKSAEPNTWVSTRRMLSSCTVAS